MTWTPKGILEIKTFQEKTIWVFQEGSKLYEVLTFKYN